MKLGWMAKQTGGANPSGNRNETERCLNDVDTCQGYYNNGGDGSAHGLVVSWHVAAICAAFAGG